MKNVADIYTLSPMQQLMLFHAKTVDNDQDVLFNQIVYHIAGPLQREAYRQAWQLLVDRHPALRTIFVWQNGKDPLQIVREKVQLPWKDLDWRQLTAPAQQDELDKFLAADRAAGFDLHHAPLMRLALIQVSDQDYKLVWSSHHLIVDRWCESIIFDELKSIYEAYANNTSPTLTPPPLFSDYIAWLAAQDDGEAQAFWRGALAGAQVRPLPLRPPHQEVTDAPDEVEVAITGEDWKQLRQFALENGVTSGTLVIGAWAIVLGAVSGAEEALFGLTVSGRPAQLPHAGKTVGCFINNVPLRVSFAENTGVGQWLEMLQDKQLELQPYEYASPAQIQAWSGFKTGGPLFDTLVVLQAPQPQAVPEKLEIRFERGGMQTGYPIALGVVPEQDELQLNLTYDRRRVPPEMAGQMVTALRRVLRGMTAEEGALLRNLRTLPQIELPVAASTAVNGHGVQEKRPFTASRTATEQTLAQIWADVLSLPRVGIEDQFYALGGDSIKALQLFTLIEQQFGKNLPISLLFGDPTLTQMAEAIAADDAELPADPALVPLNEEGSRPPVFFAHGVYGSLVWLTNLLPLLASDQPAYGLQAAGLQPDYEPDYSIEAMATRYVRSIRRIQPSGPYYLGGFCFGGVVAYEIARQLEQLGEETALLAIIDTFPPDISHRKRPIYDPFRWQIIRESAPFWFRGYNEFGGWRLRERIGLMLGRGPGPQQQIEAQAKRNEEFDYLADFTTSDSEKQRRITEINHRAAENYVPQVYRGQVMLFQARLLGIRHALFGPVDLQRGWERLAQGGVSVRPVAGSHVGLLTNPHVSDLAAQLNETLQTAVAATH